MFETSVYKNRRARLKEKVKSGLVLILGNGEAPANYTDNTYKFRQDSSFLYFFGLNQPGFAGVIDIDSGDEYIFGNDVDMDDIIWMGPQPSVKDMAARVGVSKTAPFARLADCRKRRFLRDAGFIFYLLIVSGICSCSKSCWVSGLLW